MDSIRENGGDWSIQILPPKYPRCRGRRYPRTAKYLNARPIIRGQLNLKLHHSQRQPRVSFPEKIARVKNTGRSHFPHIVLKYPSRRDGAPEIGDKFFFSKKYLLLAQSGLGDWVLLYMPRRSGISDFGTYYAIAFVDDIVEDPNRRGYYILSLSRIETLHPPLRAISPSVIYEKGLAEPGWKSPPQRQVRKLSDQEFINILQDHIQGTVHQTPFNASSEAQEERSRQVELIKELIQRDRERIRQTFPHEPNDT